MSGEMRMKRIKRENKAEMNLLSSILAPEVLHKAVPRLADVQEARIEMRNMKRQMDTFTDYAPGTQFHHVAQIDIAPWSAILEVFAKFDPETGNPMHDGLLFITDEHGKVMLNRDFFYSLIEMLETAGYVCDMRTRKRLV
jgi:hypothetical protein